MKNTGKRSVPDEQGPNRQMLRRALLLMAVCGAAAFAVLLARLGRIQLVQHDYFEQRAMEQQCILPKQYEQITRKVYDCRNLLGAWMVSDRKRFGL